MQKTSSFTVACGKCKVSNDVVGSQSGSVMSPCSHFLCKTCLCDHFRSIMEANRTSGSVQPFTCPFCKEPVKLSLTTSSKILQNFSNELSFTFNTDISEVLCNLPKYLKNEVKTDREKFKEVCEKAALKSRLKSASAPCVSAWSVSEECKTTESSTDNIPFWRPPEGQEVQARRRRKQMTAASPEEEEKVDVLRKENDPYKVSPILYAFLNLCSMFIFESFQLVKTFYLVGVEKGLYLNPLLFGLFILYQLLVHSKAGRYVQGSKVYKCLFVLWFLVDVFCLQKIAINILIKSVDTVVDKVKSFDKNWCQTEVLFFYSILTLYNLFRIASCFRFCRRFLRWSIISFIDQAVSVNKVFFVIYLYPYIFTNHPSFLITYVKLLYIKFGSMSLTEIGLDLLQRVFL